MPYVTQLSDRAAVFRPTISEGETGQRKATMIPVAGMSAVPCKFLDAGQARVQKLFGATVEVA